MKSHRTVKIQEYFEKFQNRGSLTIAKLLYADFPEMFSSVENARDAIRIQRGSHGEQKRKQMKIKENITPKFIIPEDDNVSYEDYVIDENLKVGIVLSDIHDLIVQIFFFRLC